MADLRDMLGDVYRDRNPDGAPVTHEPAAAERPPQPVADQVQPAPEWADDAHLDAAFADWSPGPPPDAPKAEREMAHGLGVSTSAPPSIPGQPLPDDLAAALSEALVDAPPGEVSLQPATAFDPPPTVDEPIRATSFSALVEADDVGPTAEATPPAPEDSGPAPDVNLDPAAPPVAPAPTDDGSQAWQRDHDDILPHRSGRSRSRGLSLRR